MEPTTARFATPTPREIEVLKLTASGLSTKQIAISLGISFKTAACHRAHLMDKLGIHEIAGLTRYAVQHGYIQLSEPEPALQPFFSEIRLTYAEYRKAMDDYAAFLEERKSFGLDNPDSSTGARKFRQAEKAAHEKYHAALLAVKKHLIPDSR